MPKRVKVNWPELIGAFEDAKLEERYWLDTETGEVLMLADYLEEEDRQEVIDAVDGDVEGRYREIPERETGESYQLMEDFIETVKDSHFRELLEVAIQGRGAFGRFRDVLARRPKERERWFAYKDDHFGRLALEWLEEEDLEPENPE